MTDHKKFTPRLQILYNESLKELAEINNYDYNIITKIINKNTLKPMLKYSYALYPRRFYKNINTCFDKEYDFIFIGGLMRSSTKVWGFREWIIEFIKKNFNSKSYLQFTDAFTLENHKPFGDYDFSLSRSGFIPRNEKFQNRGFFDKNFFSNMQKSKFCLCPGGDCQWSMRFYEALMCKCIPIVQTKSETFRSIEESRLDYKFYLSDEQDFYYRSDWVEHNYNIFIKYHTLERYV